MPHLAEDSSASPAGHPRQVILWIAVSEVICLASLASWLVMSLLSVMAFDSGYSTEAAVFVGVVWGYPLLPIFAAVATWILVARKRYRAAVIVTSIPLLIALPLLAYIGFAAVYNNFISRPSCGSRAFPSLTSKTQKTRHPVSATATWHIRE